jgi:drug/metabolite transporter (DMT)-like permease
MTILVYIFYFITATASPLQRRQQAKVTESNLVFLAAAVQVFVATAGFFLLLFPGVNSFQLTVSNVLLTLACGLFGALFLVLSYFSQKHVDAVQSTILSNIYTPITIFLSIFLLHEGLTGRQIIGTLLLLAAVVIVSLERGTVHRFHISKYSLMMLASGVFLGLVLVAERQLIKVMGPGFGTLASWWSQALCMLIASYFFARHHVGSWPKAREVLVTGSLRFLQSISWIALIVVVGNLALISAVTTFKIVTVFLAGLIFLGERNNLAQKCLGTVIALAGLLLMK